MMETEGELKGSFREFFLSLPDPTSIMTPEGVRIDTNYTTERLFRHSRDEIIGARVEELYAKEDAVKITNALEKCKRTGFSSCGATCIKGDGTTFPAVLNFAPVKDKEGNIIHIIVSATDVTELREHEEKLKGKQKEVEEAKALYDTIFDTSTEPCIITGRDWKWTRINPAFESLTGYSAKEILGKFDYQMPFWSPEEVTRLKEYVKDKKPGEPISVEISMKSKEGKDLHLLLNEVFVKEEVSEKVGWIGYLTDITELRKREEELKQAKLFNELIIDSSTAPIMVTDKDWRWISVNSAFEKLLGYKPEEVLGKNRRELPIWTPEEYGKAEDTANQLIKKEGVDKPIEFETLLKTKDGRDLNILLREVFLGEEVSKEIGFIGYLFDVTELKKREKELDDARAYSEGIITSVADALCVVDNEGKWLTVNPAMVRITGYSEEELLSRKSPDQPFQQLPECQEALKDMARRVEAEGVAFGIEMSWLRKDGKKITVSSSEQLLKDGEGNVMGRVFTGRDITELKRATTEVAQALDALSEGNLTKKVDVLGLSGDLREMGESINESIDALNTLIEEVRNAVQIVSSTSQSLSTSTEELNASANQISSTVAQVAQGAANQAKQAEEMREASAELAILSMRAASEADSAAKGTSKAAEIALTGSRAAQDAMDRTAKIFDVTSDSVAIVKNLGELTEEVGAMVDMITNVADKTNLLSLNAAIEAARAGEQGRTFAIVADEVKKLAKESKESAEKVINIIKRIESERVKAINSINVSLKEVTEGREVINTSLLSLNEIAKLVQETASTSQTMFNLSREQEKAIRIIEKTIEDISAVAEQNAAGTEEASAFSEEEAAGMEELTTSTQELANMAEDLSQAVARFKIVE